MKVHYFYSIDFSILVQYQQTLYKAMETLHPV